VVDGITFDPGWPATIALLAMGLSLAVFAVVRSIDEWKAGGLDGARCSHVARSRAWEASDG